VAGITGAELLFAGDIVRIVLRHSSCSVRTRDVRKSWNSPGDDRTWRRYVKIYVQDVLANDDHGVVSATRRAMRSGRSE
jgi:hypothetical protein